MRKRLPVILSFALGLLSYPLGSRLLQRARLPARMAEASPGLPIPTAVVGRLRIFLLVGQSNMSGKGQAPVRQPLPGAYRFGNDYRWGGLQEPVDDPTNQVDSVSREYTAGASPAWAFAAALLAHDPRPVALVPCARDGSSLRQWQRNLSDTTLYGSLVKRARAASPMGEIAGVLCAQGEADTRAAYAWRPEFERFVSDLRADLRAPNLPVVYTQLGDYHGPELRPFWTELQSAQGAVRLPHCRLVTLRGLPMRDSLHLTPEGYDQLGRRFAAEWLADHQ